MGLPRGIIKKYGVSKKAWAVYRGTKPKTKTRSVNMARRFKISRKTRRGFRNITSGKNELVNLAVGIGGAFVYEKYISPMIPIADNTAHTAIDIAAGYLLYKQKHPMLKEVGRSIVIVNGFSLISGLMSGTSNGSTQANW